MESAAHLKYNPRVGSPPLVVTLFGKDSLECGLAPAFFKVAEYLADTFPCSNLCTRLSVNREEAWLLLSAAVESYFNFRQSASLSEAVYGLKRVLVSSGLPVNNEKKLTLISIGACAVLPYLRMKFARQCELWRIASEDGFLDERNDKYGLKTRCVRLLPYFQATIELSRLLGYLLFMSGKKLTPSWILQFMGCSLVSANGEEIAADQRSVLDSLIVGVGTFLEFSALFVQFVDWWYSSSSSSRNSRAQLANVLAKRIPKPPHDALRKSQSGSRRSFDGLCPLCCEPWRVATVLMPSGYVFCYSCIYEHVRATAKCPVAGCEADVSYLVRLYCST